MANQKHFDGGNFVPVEYYVELDIDGLTRVEKVRGYQCAVCSLRVMDRGELIRLEAIAENVRGSFYPDRRYVEYRSVSFRSTSYAGGTVTAAIPSDLGVLTA